MSDPMDYLRPPGLTDAEWQRNKDEVNRQVKKDGPMDAETARQMRDLRERVNRDLEASGRRAWNEQFQQLLSDRLEQHDKNDDAPD